MWHNKEARELAAKVQNIINAWNKGAICPSEFLTELHTVVRTAEISRLNSDLPKATCCGANQICPECE